jgi:hypothetical protein
MARDDAEDGRREIQKSIDIGILLTSQLWTLPTAEQFEEENHS